MLIATATSLKLAIYLVVLTYFFSTILLTGAETAVANAHRAGAKLGLDKSRSVSFLVQFLRTASSPFLAYMAVYSLADMMGYESTKRWTADNAGYTFAIAGVFIMAACMLSTITARNPASPPALIFETVYETLVSAFWSSVAALRIGIQVLVFALPYLAFTTIPFQIHTYGTEKLMILVIGFLCYVVLLFLTLRILGARYRNRGLLSDLGYLAALIALACFAVETNMIAIDSIVGKHCVADCLLFNFW